MHFWILLALPSTTYSEWGNSRAHMSCRKVTWVVVDADCIVAPAVHATGRLSMLRHVAGKSEDMAAVASLWCKLHSQRRITAKGSGRATGRESLRRKTKAHVRSQRPPHANAAHTARPARRPRGPSPGRRQRWQHKTILRVPQPLAGQNGEEPLQLGQLLLSFPGGGAQLGADFGVLLLQRPYAVRVGGRGGRLLGQRLYEGLGHFELGDQLRRHQLGRLLYVKVGRLRRLARGLGLLLLLLLLVFCRTNNGLACGVRGGCQWDGIRSAQ
jgi:hypothetical protein